MAATTDRTWRLTATDLDAWIRSLVRTGVRVLAPVQDGGLRRFAAVEDGQAICHLPGKTNWSPKEFLFPRTEVLFRYHADGDGVTMSDPVLSQTPQVLLGVRPCDAAGLVRLTAVLGSDPFCAHRRERTTVVSFGCAHAEPECFCTAVGGSPAGEEGSDLLFLTDGDGFLARAVTGKGELLTQDVSWPVAPAGSWEQALAAAGKVADEIRRQPIAPGSAAMLEERFAHPAWDALAERCIGCSICTYVCPSCSCFTVEDEGGPSCGTRCRSWDSCSFALFTLHGSGHNPRPDQGARFRQRVLHKFAYFQAQQKGGPPMCVGCGRCTCHCPVSIDIHEAVQVVMAEDREDADVGR